MSHLFCPEAPKALWTGRQTIGDGLSSCMGNPKQLKVKKKDVFTKDKRGESLCQLLNCFALSRPGGHGGAAAPVPIPNTAVKRPSANGTSSQDAGE